MSDSTNAIAKVVPIVPIPPRFPNSPSPRNTISRSSPRIKVLGDTTSAAWRPPSPAILSGPPPLKMPNIVPVRPVTSPVSVIRTSIPSTEDNLVTIPLNISGLPTIPSSPTRIPTSIPLMRPSNIPPSPPVATTPPIVPPATLPVVPPVILPTIPTVPTVAPPPTSSRIAPDPLSPSRIKSPIISNSPDVPSIISAVNEQLTMATTIAAQSAQPSAPIISRDNIVPIHERPSPPQDSTEIIVNGRPIDRASITPIALSTLDTDSDGELSPINVEAARVPRPPTKNIPMTDITTTADDLSTEEILIRPASPTTQIKIPESSQVSQRANNKVVTPSRNNRGRGQIPSLNQPTLRQPNSNTGRQENRAPNKPSTQQPATQSTTPKHPTSSAGARQPIVNNNSPATITVPMQPSAQISYPPRTQAEVRIPQPIQQTQSATSPQNDVRRPIPLPQSTQPATSPQNESRQPAPIVQNQIQQPVSQPSTDVREPGWDTPITTKAPATIPQGAQSIMPPPAGSLVVASPLAKLPANVFPDYSAMTPEEQMQHRANFRTRFGILRTAWPNYYIPDVPDNMPLEQVHAQYDVYIRHIHISSSVDKYKVYLVIMWLLIELFCTKIGLKIGGYTVSQMRSMNKYEQLLIELGETKYKNDAATGQMTGQSDWPVEVRIFYTALVNAVVFIVIKMVADYIGEGMADTIVNALASYVTGSPSQPGQTLFGGPQTPTTATIAPMPNIGGGGGGLLGNLDIPSLIANIGSSFIGGQAPRASNTPQTPAAPAVNNTQSAGRFRPAYEE